LPQCKHRMFFGECLAETFGMRFSVASIIAELCAR